MQRILDALDLLFDFCLDALNLFLDISLDALNLFFDFFDLISAFSF